MLKKIIPKILFFLCFLLSVWLGVNFTGQDRQSLQTQSLQYVAQAQESIMRFYAVKTELPIAVKFEVQALKMQAGQTATNTMYITNVSSADLVLQIKTQLHPAAALMTVDPITQALHVAAGATLPIVLPVRNHDVREDTVSIYLQIDKV